MLIRNTFSQGWIFASTHTQLISTDQLNQGKGGEVSAKEKGKKRERKEMSAMELERRGHLGVSRVLSHGPDIRPDINLSAQMSNDYVKVENFERWKKLNETVLRARTLKSFIAGAIFGILVLVAIIMAGVSLGKIATNTSNLSECALKEDLNALKEKKVSFADLDPGLKTKMESDLQKELARITREYRAFAKSCTSGCVNCSNSCPAK